MSTCPVCHRENRRGAKFCQYCGADFAPQRSNAPPVAASSSGKRGQATTPLPAVTRCLDEEHPHAVRLRPLDRGSVLSHPLDPQKKYGILAARELEFSTYYDALDLTCPSCQAQHDGVPPGGLCLRCQASLGVVLIHERRLFPEQLHSVETLSRLIRLSNGHVNILPHRDIVQYRETVYAVTEHPGRWGVLVRGRRQRSPDEALAGAVQMARALAYLHDKGFAYPEVGCASLESLIVVGGGRDVKLADLSACVPLPEENGQAVRILTDRDTVFVGNLLFYLAVGKMLARTDIKQAPEPLRPLIERAMKGQYATVRDMLADFSLLPAAAAPARPLKPTHGQATHPGQRYDHNEDAVVTFTFDKEQDGRAVPIGFFLVADGMGGHQAGDVASRTVNRIVTDWIIKTKVLPDLKKSTRKLTSEDVPAELLKQAIEQANRVLMERAREQGNDLGSTVTAALVIGDVATIANVGDSRTLLLRDGRLEQITQDHSLVARLVDAGVIGPEEVRSHPQRNQIYRSLGHDADAQVDTFTVQLQRGDRLILCSDGLWEMVLDEQIHGIVTAARSPQRACDALIEAANNAGGEDNIAVIVVEME